MGGACSASQPNSKAHIIKIIGKRVEAAKMEKEYVCGEDVNAIETPDTLREFFEEIAAKERWDAKVKQEIRNKIWPAVELEMTVTKIPSLDEVFDATSEPMKKVLHLQDSLRGAIFEVKSACRSLQRTGKRVTTLDGAVQLLFDNVAGNISLSVTLDPPEIDVVIGKDLKGDAADAAKSLKKMADVTLQILEEGPPIAQSMVQLLERARAATSTVKDDATKAGLNAMDTLKATKAVTVNVQKMSRFPEVIKDLIALAKSVMNDLIEAKKAATS